MVRAGEDVPLSRSGGTKRSRTLNNPIGSPVIYAISKDFTLSYSHQLLGLPEGHQCGRVHGHNGTVSAEFASDRLNEAGFIIDYGDLKPLQEWLDDRFDHRHLNDIVDFQPTAENMARHVYQWCVIYGWPIRSVGWSETPKTWAWYTGPGVGKVETKQMPPMKIRTS